MVGSLLAAVAAFREQWAKFAGLGTFGWLALSAALLAGALVLFVRGRRRRSRSLDPDALRLDLSRQDHLLGRAQEIDDLARICDAAPLVFLSGDSGAGKSALIRAGLMPRLKADPCWLPLPIDMADRDFDHGPRAAVAEGFWRALDASDRARLSLPDVPATDEALDALRRCRRDTGRRPLVILDQVDDYQLRHRTSFLNPALRTWRPPGQIAQASAFWSWLAAAVAGRDVHALLVTRSDNVSGLESLRFAEPASYPLSRLPAGFVRPIVDRLTQRPADALPVLADPEAGWDGLIERLALDIERDGSLLPQQLKTVLLGLRSLRLLNARGFERAGRAEGLEALFVEAAVRDAAAASGLGERIVLRLLLTLVDRRLRRKDAPLTARDLAVATGVEGQLDRVDLALQALAAPSRELVRPTRSESADGDAWQLDHDYLARGILRAEANADYWRTRLAERASGTPMRRAGGTTGRRSFPPGSRPRSPSLGLAAAGLSANTPPSRAPARSACFLFRS